MFTLRNIPDMLEIKRYTENERPRRAVVAGGGYIGLEMAENLKRAGIETTVAEISEHLIPSLDSDMAANVHVHIRERGIDLRLNNGIKAIIPGRALLIGRRAGNGYGYNMRRSQAGHSIPGGLPASQRAWMHNNRFAYEDGRAGHIRGGGRCGN